MPRTSKFVTAGCWWSTVGAVGLDRRRGRRRHRDGAALSDAMTVGGSVFRPNGNLSQARLDAALIVGVGVAVDGGSQSAEMRTKPLRRWPSSKGKEGRRRAKQPLPDDPPGSGLGTTRHPSAPLVAAGADRADERRCRWACWCGARRCRRLTTATAVLPSVTSYSWKSILPAQSIGTRILDEANVIMALAASPGAGGAQQTRYPAQARRGHHIGYSQITRMLKSRTAAVYPPCW